MANFVYIAAAIGRDLHNGITKSELMFKHQINQRLLHNLARTITPGHVYYWVIIWLKRIFKFPGRYVSTFDVGIPIVISSSPPPPPPPLAPLLVPAPPQFALTTEAFSFTPSNAGGAVQTYSSTALPTGLTLDATTGTISGTTTASVGITSVTVTGTNETGLNSITFPIQVPNIRFVDSAGDNSNGLSASTAWQTFDTAYGVMASSGNFLIHVADGTYAETNGENGYVIWGTTWTNCICFRAENAGAAIFKGTSSTMNIRVNSGGMDNLKFDGINFESSSTSAETIFNMTSTGVSSKIYFSNGKMTAPASLASGNGLIQLNGSATLTDLILTNWEFDTTAATGSAFCLFSGTLINATFNNVTTTGTAFTNNAGFRIQEAGGIHIWNDGNVLMTGTAVAIQYEATDTGTLALAFTDLIVQSTADDAILINGGTAANHILSVKATSVTASGFGGMRIDAYVDQVVIDDGSYTSTSSSPALAVQMDGVPGVIDDITITSPTALNSGGGHGMLIGVDATNIVVDNGTYTGSDHSFVCKANGGTITNTTCESASATSMLLKGARDIILTDNQFNNSATGGFCVDIRADDATLADTLTIKGNILSATGAAKALSVTDAGIGDGIIENSNTVNKNTTANIRGNLVSSLANWNADGWDSPTPYAVLGNGIELLN